jgi:hypothetical protein
MFTTYTSNSSPEINTLEPVIHTDIEILPGTVLVKINVFVTVFSVLQYEQYVMKSGRCTDISEGPAACITDFSQISAQFQQSTWHCILKNKNLKTGILQTISDL